MKVTDTGTERARQRHIWQTRETQKIQTGERLRAEMSGETQKQEEAPEISCVVLGQRGG